MSRAELYAKIKSHGGIADLSARAQFHLTGADRVRYLNGQVSSDVRKLDAQRAMPACVMTAKGKMCADIFITAGKNLLRVDAEPSLRESLAARLERYIIADDVVLEDVTEQTGIIHFIQPRSGQSENFSELEFQSTASQRFGFDGVDLILPRGDFEKYWTQLGEKFSIADSDMLETLRIEAGIPRWGFELGEETIPVEAGLDRTSIDYHKGCYIGQEVISRIKSVGHVNRLLHGFISTGGVPLQRGLQLFAPENPAQPVGTVTSAAYSFAFEKPVALGYLRRGTHAGTLIARHPAEAGGQEVAAVEVRKLPFIP
jgi:folate-binding protein YgfZ